MAQHHKADIVVVGFHGRKGQKEDLTIMGTAVQFMGQKSLLPTMIIKNPSRREDHPNGYTFAAAIDGSQQSIHTLDLLCNLQQGEDKLLVLIYDHENIDVQKVKAKVEGVLKTKNCKCNSDDVIKILPRQKNKIIGQIFREFLNSNSNIDFVLVGNKGADLSNRDTKKYLGSIANEIITNTKINVIFMPSNSHHKQATLS